MTRSVEIPEAAVEAGAEAYWDYNRDAEHYPDAEETWGVLVTKDEDGAQVYREAARSVLEGALPYLAPAAKCSCTPYMEPHPEMPYDEPSLEPDPDCPVHFPAPVGDGGLREALENQTWRWDHEDCRVDLPENEKWAEGVAQGYRNAAADLRRLLAARPAAPAVPQPDRERVAEVLHESDWRFDHGWKESGRCGEVHREQFYAQADAVLAVLAGDQEQVEP